MAASKKTAGKAAKPKTAKAKPAKAKVAKAKVAAASKPPAAQPAAARAKATKKPASKGTKKPAKKAPAKKAPAKTVAAPSARRGRGAESAPAASGPKPRTSRAPGAPALPRAFASAKDVQLLVVDDEPEVLNLLVPFLKKRGYSVTEAEDGDQALEKILTDRPHVVLLDVMMPGLNGWEIARYVRDREELDGVRIVMATGIGEEMNAATAPLHGADAYLDKPFRLDDVERIVLEVLNRHDHGPAGRAT